MSLQPAYVAVLTAALAVVWVSAGTAAEDTRSVVEFRSSKVRAFTIDEDGTIKTKQDAVPVADFGPGPWKVLRTDPRNLVLLESRHGQVWVRQSEVRLNQAALPDCIVGVAGKSGDTRIAGSNGAGERSGHCIRQR